MMTPVPMRHLSISLLTTDLIQAGLVLARFGQFVPQPLAARDERLSETPESAYLSTYHTARSRLLKIFDFFQLQPMPQNELPDKAPDLAKLGEQAEWLGEVWRHCSACAESQRRYAEQLRDLRQLQALLRNYRSLDLNLGLLREEFRFLHIETGTIPLTHLDRLREAVAMIHYTVNSFSPHDGRVHVVIAGLKENRTSLETVLKAADFHALPLPPEFSDHPSKVAAELKERENRTRQKLRHMQREIDQNREAYRERLNDAAADLLAASGFAQFGPALRSRGGLAHLSGWVPEKQLPRLKKALERQLQGPVIIESRAPAAKESRTVPSYIPHNRWLQPFTFLVRNYGPPRYREIDPTWFFAISFVTMFGMMFGDLGHGALIVLGASLLKGRLTLARPALVAAGLSSMLFGLLYGSVFGYEHLIPPLWLSPLSDPVLMLKVAFAWGVLFILVATLITIRNDLVEKALGKALFDSQGVAGLVLYLSLLISGWHWSTTGSLPISDKIALGASLLTILGYKWRHQHSPFGERLLVVAVEGFETFLNYISNTLSFLRVAAFGLNHVALSIAVFTLADMMGSAGHWITVVLGNLFILVLEGAIVVIQVLRLEYYEGFSRFFRGDGLEFRPMRLSVDELMGAKVW